MALQRDKITANAEKLVARGKIDQAIKEYERLLDESPNDVNTLNRIGDLWVRIERNDEAVKVFRKIADHYSRDGFFLKAIAIYKKINKLDPAKLDIYGKLAELYAKQGLAMEAKSQYTVLADYFLKHGDVPSAIGIYHKIADLDPHSVNIHIKLADLYSQNHQSADALREYERVGRMLLKRGMTAEAMQVFRKALRIESGSVELAESLIGTLLEEKDHENAIHILKAALESNRENPTLIALLARTQLSKGDVGPARATLEQGLRSNPSDVVIRELLTDAYLHDGSVDEALELIQPLIAVAGARAEGRLALDLLNRILRSQPSNIVALERLANVQQRLGDDAGATDTLSRLSGVHIARSEYDAAETILRDLLTRHNDRSDLREKLALVLHRTGRSLGDLSVSDIEQFQDLVPGAKPQPQGSQTTAEPSITPPLEEEIEFEFEVNASAPLVEEARTGSLSPPRVVELDENRATVSADLNFATERVTEADVFAKYGLTEKAIEHLRSALERVPDYLPAYEKLLMVFLSEGDSAAAASTADAYTALLRQRGDFQKAEEIEERLVTRGFLAISPEAAADSQPEAVPLIDIEMPEPSQQEAPTAAAEATAGAPDVEEFEEEFEVDLDQFSDLPEAPALVDAAGPEPVEESEAPVAAEPAAEELTAEEPPAEEPSGEEPPAEEPPAEVPPAEEPKIEEPVIEEPVIEEPVIEELVVEELVEEEPVAEELVVEEPTPEEMASGETAAVEEFIAAEQVEQQEAADTFAQSATVEPPADFGNIFGEISPIEEPSLRSEEVSTGAVIDDEPETVPVPEFDGWSEESDAHQESIESAPVEAEAPGLELPPSLSGSFSESSFGGMSEEGDALVEMPESFSAPPNVEDLGELDFYIEQELFEEATNKLRALTDQFPEDPGLKVRSEKLAGLRAHGSVLHAASPTSGPIEPSGSEQATASAPPPVVAEEEDLFSAEDSFFDLAAELESELAEDVDEAATASEDEQSLEQIFREFKKGVEQQLDSEDYDTHYNLGIAYKEMGLIDEAIGEFQLASKDPKRAIDGCSMLGLCFLEKGMPQLAIKWYGKGLEHPEITEEEHLGLLYDLGNAYLEVGDTSNAHKAFIEVYGINNKYRDVVSRIKQLEEVRRVQ